MNMNESEMCLLTLTEYFRKIILLVLKLDFFNYYLATEIQCCYGFLHLVGIQMEVIAFIQSVK